MAAATVLRPQTIPSREVAAEEPVIVTVGVLRAGTRVNVIPDDALLRINIRTFNDDVRTRALAAVDRIVKAEAAASGAPAHPEITVYGHFPLTVNDPATARHAARAFRHHFGADRVTELVDPLPVSEDVDAGHFVWEEAPTKYAAIVLDSITGNWS
jgi:metal-dependent amidase/aminoacylase/carboxypeptidase family protein